MVWETVTCLYFPGETFAKLKLLLTFYPSSAKFPG